MTGSSWLDGDRFSRGSFLLGTAGLVAGGLAACSGSSDEAASTTTGSAGGQTTTAVEPVDCPAAKGGAHAPLWAVAIERGLVYGSSAATWQLSDAEYERLYGKEAGILFTEDDLLWWRLRPKPDSDLNFKHGDQIVDYATKNGMLVLGAHLVWDQGYGEGWTDDDLRGLDKASAEKLLYGTIDREVARYRGRVNAWIVANEVVDELGQRTDVPWYETIGPDYVTEAFHRARAADPDATLLINDFGFEADDQYTFAADKRAAMLDFLDELLAANVPVDALGVQAHLNGGRFADGGFDPDAYRTFLADVADRGLKILVTEMDVLDDGLPKNPEARDRGVADATKQYLEAALDEPAVAALVTFGLSDRYTWLQEDYPRDDGAPRRPLPFDENMKPKPAYTALREALASAPKRNALWTPPRCA